jgi:hypothetical protein
MEGIMKIKYSPCLTTPETQVKFIDEWTIEIDDERFEFSPELVEYPDVSEQTAGKVQHAEVKDGELYLTVRFNYQDKAVWENPDYYEGGGYRGAQYEDIG